MTVELVGLTCREMEDLLVHMGEPAYRGRQVCRWVYREGAGEVGAMTDLPLTLRRRLAESVTITLPVLQLQRQSRDGTRKLLLGLEDGLTVETVLIPQPRRAGFTLCLSSQVGCPVGCPLCATGMSGFRRNLGVHEIVGQYLLARGLLRQGEQTGVIRNVVFMGMGEPLLNYEAVLKAVRILTDTAAVGMAQRHVTISTAGEVEGIRRLAGEGLQVNLAVSLHAATNRVRDVLVPLNRKYPLELLEQALQEYFARTGRRITLEYVLVEGVNTSNGDARALARFARSLRANVNLIPYNPVSGSPYRRPSAAEVRRFQREVEAGGVRAPVRQEHGSDIEAACGQLRAKNAPGRGRKSAPAHRTSRE